MSDRKENRGGGARSARADLPAVDHSRAELAAHLGRDLSAAAVGCETARR